MAQYYNPPTDIPTIGRQINGSSFNALKAQLRSEEVLVTYADRVVFKFAQLSRHQEDIDDIENQYNQGRLISRSFYAVSVEKLENHLEGS